MTDAQRKIYDDFFTRYGNPTDDAEIRIQHTFYKPDTIYDVERLTTYDKWADDTIKQLEKAIEKAKIYRMAICERYNELYFANIQKIVKLKREKRYHDNKVYYYLMFIDRYENGHEQIINSIKYAGKERKKAIEDFEKFAKNNKNYIAIKDIEKSRWENK